jgi:hypothetical protein
MKDKTINVRINKIRLDGEYEMYRGKLTEVGDGYIKLDLQNGNRRSKAKVKNAILATDMVLSVWEYK